MITHKVAELEGPLLDAAVALAEGIHPYNFRNKWCLIVDENEDETVVYEPSVDWELAGPIIERERIDLDQGSEWVTAMIHDDLGDDNFSEIAVGVGPTPLIAAMRAYVASKFGETVELP
jgi:hypothetical protein